MKQKKAHASHPVGNRTVIGIICLVVALAICFGIAPLVNRLSDGKTKIVRLIRDISAGATITEADIEVADVGSYNLPTGVIKDKAQVVGKCALSNLTKGDYLFPSKIGNDTNNAGRMLESLDENHKAISRVYAECRCEPRHANFGCQNQLGRSRKRNPHGQQFHFGNL